MQRPTATKVEVYQRHVLKITFDNGEIRLFDVIPYIKGSWYGELENEGVFHTVKTNGYSIEWEGGQDICPDDLYYNSVRMNEMEELVAKLYEVPNAYFGYIAGVTTYARKNPNRMATVLKYLNENEVLTTSDVIKFITEQPDFFEDMVPAYQENDCEDSHK